MPYPRPRRVFGHFLAGLSTFPYYGEFLALFPAGWALFPYFGEFLAIFSPDCPLFLITAGFWPFSPPDGPYFLISAGFSRIFPPFCGRCAVRLRKVCFYEAHLPHRKWFTAVSNADSLRKVSRKYSHLPHRTTLFAQVERENQGEVPKQRGFGCAPPISDADRREGRRRESS